jgi:hypothetical protein
MWSLASRRLLKETRLEALYIFSPLRVRGEQAIQTLVLAGHGVNATGEVVGQIDRPLLIISINDIRPTCPKENSVTPPVRL